MTVVTLEEAESSLPLLVRKARAGEEVVISENGVEIARIVQMEPVAAAGEQPKPRRQGGFLKGEIVEIDPDWWKPDDEMADLFEGSDSFEGPRGNWLKP